MPGNAKRLVFVTRKSETHRAGEAQAVSGLAVARLRDGPRSRAKVPSVIMRIDIRRS